MKKRILMSALWGYVGWYAGALVAGFMGLNEALGPTVGALAVVLALTVPARAQRFGRSSSRAGQTTS